MRRRAHQLEPREVVLLDRLGPAGKIAERVTVRGEHHRDVGAERGDLVERVEERGQRVTGAEPTDVRGDRRQHVVPRQHHALGRVEQAQVILGVARCVHGDPLAPAQHQRLGVVDAHRGSRDAHEARGVAREQVPRAQLRRHLHRLTAPRRRAERVVAPLVRWGVQRRGVLDIEVARIEAVPEHHETPMGDDVGARLAAHELGAAVVVGVRVRHHHRVDAPHRDAGRAQTLADGGARRPSRQAGVDERDTTVVLDDVAVGVPEAGHVDRQLGAQHPGGDLGDVGGGPLLLLAGRARCAAHHYSGAAPPDPISGPLAGARGPGFASLMASTLWTRQQPRRPERRRAQSSTTTRSRGTNTASR